jgi:hypothetical protein
MAISCTEELVGRRLPRDSTTTIGEAKALICMVTEEACMIGVGGWERGREKVAGKAGKEKMGPRGKEAVKATEERAREGKATEEGAKAKERAREEVRDRHEATGIKLRRERKGTTAQVRVVVRQTIRRECCKKHTRNAKQLARKPQW